MNTYRCYFLHAATKGAASSIDSVESFDAATDDEGRQKADEMFQKKAIHVLGYELWRDNRLVHRYLMVPTKS